MLSLRGTLRGKMALRGAGSGFPMLAPASVLPGQAVYLGCRNRSAGHGKERVHGELGLASASCDGPGGTVKSPTARSTRRWGSRSYQHDASGGCHVR